MTDFIRGSTRPVVTIIFAAAIAQIVVEGINPPGWFLSLAIPILLWWFGERTIGHIKEGKDVAKKE